MKSTYWGISLSIDPLYGFYVLLLDSLKLFRLQKYKSIFFLATST